MMRALAKSALLFFVLGYGLFDQFRLLIVSTDWNRVLWATDFDSILLSWIAEWGYQSLFLHFSLERFWNSSIFFPHQNTLAYSDCLLGFQPFYDLLS